MTKIDMDALKKSAPRTYRTVIKELGLDFRRTFGEQDIDLLRLPQFTRGEMLGWLAAQVLKPAAAAPVAEPAVPVVAQHEEPEAIKDAMDFQKNDARRRVEQQARDEEAGLARLEQFCVEQGLQRTSENAAKVQQWLNQNVKGYWSQQGVDAAVLNLRNELTWASKEAPAPPEPAEPSEVLGTLPDGTTQLPLNVDKFTLNRASKEQARDWLKRHNAGKLRRSHGGFGSSF